MNLSLKNCLYTLLVFLLFSTMLPTAFGQQVISVDTSNYQTLRIDPASAEGGYVSDILEKLEYIPLETTKESLFGGVSQLEVLSDHYVIYDEDTDCILIFKNNGKFLSKIKGKSAGSGKKINEFGVNRWTNQIVFSYDSYKTITYADLTGKIIRTLSRKNVSPYEVSFGNYQFLGKDKTVHFQRNSKFGEDVDFSSLLSYRDGFQATSAVAFPYSRTESEIDVLTSGIGPLTYSGSDTTVFFSKPYEYAIYNVSPAKISLSYKFILPGPSSLPADFLGPRFDPQKRYPFLDKNRDLVFCINNFYRVKNTLLFEASVHGIYKEECLIYNLKSGNLVAYKHITPDELSYNLPIYDPVGITFANTGLAACDGEFVYTSISSLALFEAQDSKQKYNDTLANYFSTGKKSDNPVILKFKLKEQL